MAVILFKLICKVFSFKEFTRCNNRFSFLGFGSSFFVLGLLRKGPLSEDLDLSELVAWSKGLECPKLHFIIICGH